MKAHEYQASLERGRVLSDGCVSLNEGSSIARNQVRLETLQGIIGRCIGALTACALVVAWGNTAPAQPLNSVSDSDSLSVTIAGSTPLHGILTEAQEATPIGLTIQVPGRSVDFFREGYGVSDNVTFGPFSVTLHSSPDEAITQRGTGEDATLSLKFSSDSDPSTLGAESDRIELDLDTPDSPTKVFRIGTLTEAGTGREIGTFDLPQIELLFNEGGGLNSDVLVVGPVSIDFTSDSEIPLPATGNITIDGESGSVFVIRAVSDSDAVPEPATLALLATGLLTLGIMRRRTAA